MIWRTLQCLVSCVWWLAHLLDFLHGIKRPKRSSHRARDLTALCNGSPLSISSSSLMAIALQSGVGHPTHARASPCRFLAALFGDWSAVRCWPPYSCTSLAQLLKPASIVEQLGSRASTSAGAYSSDMSRQCLHGAQGYTLSADGTWSRKLSSQCLVPKALMVPALTVMYDPM
ncbi:hypothetical protein KP509_24G055700 [Ceratopteris richardii]|uniref:Secreted protein n=1 Tax=Ceratopteris richardii TaxID=49495 RepID=A0A8T2RVI6_CERRI|nr:hypothetical protein KP509_24G055700 [Ceratopteris richardii]